MITLWCAGNLLLVGAAAWLVQWTEQRVHIPRSRPVLDVFTYY
jgi:hypothetical protein